MHVYFDTTLLQTDGSTGSKYSRLRSPLLRSRRNKREMKLRVSLAACLTVLVTAEPPNNAHFNASTLEEFLMASQKYIPHNDSSISNPPQESSLPLLADYFGAQPGFYHGVASGDPLPDAVIVWTRYTPTNVDETVTIELRMAVADATLPESSLLDPDANVNLKRANIQVSPEHDWIAKLDVTNLPSGTDFVYCFVKDNLISPIGQTRTAPSINSPTPESLTYAVFSCAHFANGYFHAYDIASTIKGLDFWVHVGDYLYEYAKFSPYASDSVDRKEQIMPDWETITLQDYRLRHATYLLDEGLLNLRYDTQCVALICMS